MTVLHLAWEGVAGVFSGGFGVMGEGEAPTDIPNILRIVPTPDQWLTDHWPIADAGGMQATDLRAWRTEHGYSQAVLALMLGVRAETVSRWERGTRAIPPLAVLALRLLEREDRDDD